MSHGFWQLVLDWVPFLVFIGLLIYFMRVLTRLQQDAYRTFMTDQLTEIRRMNGLLERIANTLEKQPSGR